MSSVRYHEHFGKIAKTLLASGLALGLSSCNVAKKSESCQLDAEGLREEGFNGQSLADLQLSLIFLKGPSESSEKIGEFLAEEGVSATFFAKGEEVEAEHDALKDLKDHGHVIGTGGFTFTDLSVAYDPVLELRAADALITEFTMGDQFWLYGPEGSLSSGAKKQLLRAGLGKYVGPIFEDRSGEEFLSDEECWDLDMSVSACTQNYLNELQRLRHGIVAFHDTDTRTEELIRELLPELHAFGFSFVRLDQVPDLRVALAAAGGTPDATKADKSCDDYE